MASPGPTSPFLVDSQIKPATPALEKTLHHVGATKTDCQLVAGHSWLRDHELRSPDTVAVADPDLIFQQALGREIFPERTPGPLRVGQFALPKGIVL